MNIELTKIEVTKKILNVKSEKVLTHIKAVLESYNVDFWDELTNEQKHTIQNAKKQIQNGEGIEHAEIVKKYSKTNSNNEL